MIRFETMSSFPDVTPGHGGTLSWLRFPTETIGLEQSSSSLKSGQSGRPSQRFFCLTQCDLSLHSHSPGREQLLQSTGVSSDQLLQWNRPSHVEFPVRQMVWPVLILQTCKFLPGRRQSWHSSMSSSLLSGQSILPLHFWFSKIQCLWSWQSHSPFWQVQML